MYLGPPVPPPSRKKTPENKEDEGVSQLLNNFTKQLYRTDNFYANSIKDMYSNEGAVSGICVLSSVNKYQKYYRKCEYCATINNVSYEINNCEACGAQFGLLDFLDNVRIAETIRPSGKEDYSSYKRLALHIIENAFKKHVDFHKNVDDIINCLTILSDEKIAALMGYLIGFIKPDKMFKTNE